MPVTTQYSITGPGEKQSGLGDFVLSGFFGPAESKNGITWAAGPVFLLPVGTNDYLTGDKFGIGPTAVILKQSAGFTFGALVNQIWSVAGPLAIYSPRDCLRAYAHEIFMALDRKDPTRLRAIKDRRTQSIASIHCRQAVRRTLGFGLEAKCHLIRRDRRRRHEPQRWWR